MAKGGKNANPKKMRMSKGKSSSDKSSASKSQSKGKKKNAPAAGGIKKAAKQGGAGGRRWKPGTVAIREIKKYQKSIKLVVPRASFARTVRVIAHKFDNELRFQASALEALQEATEMHLTALFEDCQLLAVHANRVTIQAKDMLLARRIRGDEDADFNDYIPKTGQENFMMLPYKKDAEKTEAIKKAMRG